MRFSKLLRNLWLPVLALALVSLAMPLLAQQHKPDNPQLPDPNTQLEPPPSTQSGSHNAQSPDTSQGEQNPRSTQEKGQEQISSRAQQTFLGKIARSKGDYVLKGATGGMTYKLDRQDLVKPYDGKQVRITGSLEDSSNTIHVFTVEPASAP